MTGSVFEQDHRHANLRWTSLFLAAPGTLTTAVATVYSVTRCGLGADLWERSDINSGAPLLRPLAQPAGEMLLNTPPSCLTFLAAARGSPARLRSSPNFSTNISCSPSYTLHSAICREACGISFYHQAAASASSELVLVSSILQPDIRQSALISTANFSVARLSHGRSLDLSVERVH
ncbi:hypothetical protein E4U55_006652 [Claviceps digitariae]|nr:hypothetical protein E4U55_006652 [Claviceps digitariae]